MTQERDPNWADAQGVGNVHSNEKGSGARFNNGKPAMELLPLRDVATLLIGDLGGPTPETVCLSYLAAFQEGNDVALFNAMQALGNPRETLTECAQVFDYGKRKYAEWNWAKGMKWSIPLACATRHLLAMAYGEEIDPVEEKGSGLPHRGHVMCNLFMLALYVRNFKEGDDRPVEWLRPPSRPFNVDGDYLNFADADTNEA